MLLLYGSYSGYHTQYFNVMVAMVMCLTPLLTIC